jgi:hypothetical protein
LMVVRSQNQFTSTQTTIQPFLNIGDRFLRSNATEFEPPSALTQACESKSKLHQIKEASP